jgi:hypothetical protein
VRDLLGEPLFENLFALKSSEWERYGKWTAEHAGQAGDSRWENDEYLMAY